jgi:hypothetical protein
VEDPWKMEISGSVKSSRVAPPNPESLIPRVSSGPQRSLSRGRLMEGPSLTTSTNDGWDDDAAAWLLPSDKANAFPSPIRWDRRSRSSGDFSPLHKTSSSDHWRLGSAASADSGERSLYDDSGERITTSRHKVSAGSPRGAVIGPLGSSSRPIVATNTSAPSPRPAQDGSLNRPIAILDFVDILDEREKDVLQHAARKKMPVKSVDVHKRNTTDLREKDILQAASKQRESMGGALVHESPVAVTNTAILADDLPPSSGKVATTPRQNKGIMGFIRGNVRSSFVCKVVDCS